MTDFRSSLSWRANFSGADQQGVISCENIYLFREILLNHLGGVVQLSIWGVRWFGLCPPAVFESYLRLHTSSSDNSMVLAQEASLRTHPEFNSLPSCQVTISVGGFEKHITWHQSHKVLISIAFSVPLDAFIPRHRYWYTFVGSFARQQKTRRLVLYLRRLISRPHAGLYRI